MKRRDPEQRFWAKVDKTDTCWLWTAGVRSDGYGWFWVGAGCNPALAHRWAYEALVGPVPDDLTLDHLCRVRNCVRPDHLEPVTSLENIMRGLGPIHQALKTHCPQGHEFSGDNLYVNPANGWRACRKCMVMYQRNYRARKRAAIA